MTDIEILKEIVEEVTDLLADYFSDGSEEDRKEIKKNWSSKVIEESIAGYTKYKLDKYK